MAKVLISLLGTGNKIKNDERNNNYETTNYKIDNNLYENESFVSSAIIKHYNIERLFLIGTNKSMWDNVADEFNSNESYTLGLIEKKDESTLMEKHLDELNDNIDKNLGNKKSKCFIVENGENEDELWAIFDKFIEIIDKIDTNDEIYFDITHLFRSLSLMSFIMAEFGKTYKKYKISGVFYGLLKKNEPSSIINLSIFFELLDWSRAIANLKNYGNAFEIMKLLNDSDESKTLKNSFTNFSNALSISNMSALQSSIKIIKSKISLFENSDNKIMNLISKDLKAFIQKLDTDEDRLDLFQFKLSKWYAENKNYSMAYITLAEATVSAICRQENLDITEKNDRKQAQGILVKYNDWNSSNTKEKEQLGKTYSAINKIRNNIAHKTSNNGSTPKDSIENIDKYIKIITKLF